MLTERCYILSNYLHKTTKSPAFGGALGALRAPKLLFYAGNLIGCNAFQSGM